MKIKVSIDTGFPAANREEEIDVPDNATDDEIEEAARECFFNNCNYGWSRA